MAVESASDLAAFFDTAAFAVTAEFYPAAGPSVSVAVILDDADNPAALQSVGVSARQRTATATIAAFGGVTPRGGRLEIGGEIFRIAGVETDPSRQVYTLSLRPPAES